MFMIKLFIPIRNNNKNSKMICFSDFFHPFYVFKVCTEGRLVLEFTFDDLMRIKSWHMQVRTHRELVPRAVVGMHTAQQDPSALEQLTKNITRQGITNSTLNYLRVSPQNVSTILLIQLNNSKFLWIRVFKRKICDFHSNFVNTP